MCMVCRLHMFLMCVPLPMGAEIPELKPLGDRILVKVQESADVTIGGVILPDSAKERPLRCGVALVALGLARCAGISA